LSPSRLLALLGALAAFALASSPAQASPLNCGDTITQDARLDADLLNCPGDGIVIGADGVTLDLNGHTIDGRGSGTGVSARGYDDVGVVRGAIQGFATGVSFEDVFGGAVRKVAFGGNGIACTSSQGCVIEGNAVYGAGIVVVRTGTRAATVIRENLVRGASGAGITVNFTGAETAVTGNRVEGAGIGIEALHASVGRIAANSISGSSGPGIHASLGGDTTIDRNMIWRNGGDGIALDHFLDVRLFRNVVLRNGKDGIHGEALPRPLVQDNVVSRNRGNGIFLGGVAPGRESSGFALLSANVALRNRLDGIALTAAAPQAELTGNRALRNGDDGIDVAGSATGLSENRSHRNADLGIDAVGSAVDGGGNRARRNGARAQCRHVRCR
jgi:parallel beta helix pectate lyase-like protein